MPAYEIEITESRTWRTTVDRETIAGAQAEAVEILSRISLGSEYVGTDFVESMTTTVSEA